MQQQVSGDFHVHRAVIGKNAPVSVGTVDVVNEVPPDGDRPVLRPYVHGAAVHQFPGNTFPECFRHADFIVFDYPGCHAPGGIRKVKSYADGGIGEVLEIVALDQKIRSLAVHDGRIRHLEAIVQEPAVLNPGIPAPGGDFHRAQIALAEFIARDTDVVGSVQADGRRPQTFEPAVCHRDGIGVYARKIQQRLPGAIRQEKKVRKLDRLERTVLKQEETGRCGRVKVRPLRRRAQDVAGQAAAEPQFRPDPGARSGVFLEIQETVPNADDLIVSPFEPLGEDDPHIGGLRFRQIRLVARNLVHSLPEQAGNGPESGFPDRLPDIDSGQGGQIGISLLRGIPASVLGTDQDSAVSFQAQGNIRRLDTRETQMAFPVEIGARFKADLHLPLPRPEDGVDPFVQPVEILPAGHGKDAGQEKGQEHVNASASRSTGKSSRQASSARPDTLCRSCNNRRCSNIGARPLSGFPDASGSSLRVRAQP